MEQTPAATPEGPYNDPTIIEASHGDRLLLDRLVARRIAHDFLAQYPDDPIAQHQFELMDQEVTERRRALGLLPPEETT